MTHAKIHLRPSYTSWRISGSIHTTCLVTWQPCCATDMSTNRRQSFLCSCTTSVEQAAGAQYKCISYSYSYSYCKRGRCVVSERSRL